MLTLNNKKRKPVDDESVAIKPRVLGNELRIDYLLILARTIRMNFKRSPRFEIINYAPSPDRVTSKRDK